MAAFLVRFFVLRYTYMASMVTIKRSPIVLIRLFVAIEFVAIALYLLGTTVDASFKYGLFALLPFSEIFTYQTLKLALLPLGQLIITIYAFLYWYRESYTVRSGLATHARGVVFRKERVVPITADMAITITSGPLGKLFQYGSLAIENGAAKPALVLRDIPRPQKFLRAIRQIVALHQQISTEVPRAADLLAMDEGEHLEFKSSLRFDHKTGRANRELEKAAMKTIAALLNSKGGHLVLGVDNARQIVGLSHDYPLLQRQNADGFENHFTQIFNSMIGPEFRHLIKLNFENIGGAEICIVRATPSNRPVYLKSDSNEHFYIRTGNTTTYLKLSEIEAYSRTRFI